MDLYKDGVPVCLWHNWSVQPIHSHTEHIYTVIISNSGVTVPPGSEKVVAFELVITLVQRLMHQGRHNRATELSP